MIKLIASDLDGTLLQDGTQELTPRAISLIHSLTQKGIHFVAASGILMSESYLIRSKMKFLILERTAQSVCIRANLFSAERSEMTLLTGSSGK